MSFAAPLALLLLLPWAATAALVWRRRRGGTPRPVPFVSLWVDSRPRVAAAVGRPPWPVVASLIALLLVCLAAAGPSPAVWERASVEVVRTDDTETPPLGDARVVATVVVEQHRLWQTAAERARAGAAVVVVADAEPPGELPNVFRVAPANAMKYGISRLARDADGQIAIEVWRSPGGPEALSIEVDGVPVGGVTFVGAAERAVGEFDVPVASTGAAVEVAAGEATARLKQVGGWPVLTISGDPSDAMQRMLAALEQARPPAPGSGEAELFCPPLDTVADRVEQRPAIAIPPIAWERLGPFQIASADPPGEGWRALVEAAGRPVVAVRETADGRRQAWFGLGSSALEADAAYVSLWAEMHSWLARGEPSWEADGLSSPPSPAGEAGELQAWLAKRAAGPLLAPPLILIAAGLLACAGLRIGR